jgi:hypothetical protein
MSTPPLSEKNATGSPLSLGLEPEPASKPASVRPSEVVIILLIVLLCLCMLGSAILVLTLLGNIPEFLQNLFSFVPATLG